MEYIASRVIFGIWLSGELPKRVSWDVKCLWRVIFGVFLNLLASSWSLTVRSTLVHPGSNIAYVIGGNFTSAHLPFPQTLQLHTSSHPLTLCTVRNRRWRRCSVISLEARSHLLLQFPLVILVSFHAAI
jgi:hypothetical protein